jgi:hypothetical protein
MPIPQKRIARLGDIMFYLGGLVWVVYALVRYGLGWDVTVRQFLPFHLVAIIPGVVLRHGADRISRWFGQKSV